MIALDTNVLIYCCDTRDPRRQQIALDLVADTADGILPWQVACEFIAAPGLLERARDLHLQQCWAFWDATLVSACIESGFTRLYSEDLPGRTN
jgi:predicted nucleic acid-binding protein